MARSKAIDLGLIARHGIAAIGISGYPDGHPRIADHELDRLLAGKLEAAAQTGLKVEIVTQFCLDAAPILAWVRRLRAHMGSTIRCASGSPARPASQPLMRYARRCGVRASTQGLARNAGLIKHLLGAAAPDGILRALIETSRDGEFGDIAPLFSFGGIAATARWMAAAAAGRIRLDREGFVVEAG